MEAATEQIEDELDDNGEGDDDVGRQVRVDLNLVLDEVRGEAKRHCDAHIQRGTQSRRQ